VRAYLKRLAERLSAQPGTQVTDKPVQRMDRQQYGNGSNGAVTDVQLQVGCADSRSYLVWMSILERQSAASPCRVLWDTQLRKDLSAANMRVVFPSLQATICQAAWRRVLCVFCVGTAFGQDVASRWHYVSQ